MMWGVAAVVAVIAGCNVIVWAEAKGRTFDAVGDVPHNEMGLLLGTSPRTPYGAVNFYYINRIRATAELYKAGKIKRIIASGGDYSARGGWNFNELTAMRDSLVARGVPDSVITLDYDGTRTLKSIVKAKEVYGLEKMTIISQKTHNERALFLAGHYGIDAVAYNAKPSHIETTRLKNEARELLARVKLFVDVIFSETSKKENK